MVVSMDIGDCDSIHPGERWKSYLAWEIYSQFISKTSVLDDYGIVRKKRLILK